MSLDSSFKELMMMFLAISLMIMGGVAVALFNYNVIIGIIAFAGIGVTAVLGARAILMPSEEPVQELKILVDLPAGTKMEVAPLLLNTVDSELFSFLLKRCTRTLDQGQMLLHYKRRGKIYDPQRKVFQVKGVFYRPKRLKVVYCCVP